MFISELDNFLKAFDHQYPEKSSSQAANIKKHARIFQLRDNPAVPENAHKAKITQFLKN